MKGKSVLGGNDFEACLSMPPKLWAMLGVGQIVYSARSQP